MPIALDNAIEEHLGRIRMWREGSQSTPEKPTWIALGRMGVYGRITLQPNGNWYYDCCAEGGNNKRHGSGHMPTLELAKKVVETIINP